MEREWVTEWMKIDRYTWRVNTTSNRTRINLLAVILVLRILAILIVFKLFSINHWIVRQSISPPYASLSLVRLFLSIVSLSLSLLCLPVSIFFYLFLYCFFLSIFLFIISPDHSVDITIVYIFLCGWFMSNPLRYKIYQVNMNWIVYYTCAVISCECSFMDNIILLVSYSAHQCDIQYMFDNINDKVITQSIFLFSVNFQRGEIVCFSQIEPFNVKENHS